MKKTIIYADDEAQLREIYQRFHNAKYAEYNAEVFSNGTDLKKRLEESVEDVALIVSDIDMPKGAHPNGIEVMEWIYLDSKNKHIPVILMSGLPYGKEALKKGAHTFLEKPIRDFSIYFSAIDSALKKSK